MKTLLFTFLIGLVLSTPSRLNDGAIYPGHGISGVSLGDSLEVFKEKFTSHPGADEDIPIDSCGIGGFHWVDVERGATGIYVYTREQKIVLFSVMTPSFSLNKGVNIGASEGQVKHQYPEGKHYVLLHSSSPMTGNADLEYWVVRDTGLAFELYRNRKSGRRLVSAIEVYARGADYYPDGCVYAPQVWKQIN